MDPFVSITNQDVSQMQVVSVNVGRPHVMVHHGQQYSSAINRQPVVGPIELTETGLVGDRVSNSSAHGGLDKAMCCYPLEHYDYLGQRLGVELATPSFGENLTMRGLVEQTACVGDVFRVGGATVQISQPRQPCNKLAMKHDSTDLPRWINERGYTGFYLRVLETGPIEAGDIITLVERPQPEMTVAVLTRARLDKALDREQIDRLASLAELSEAWRSHFANRR